MKTKKSEQRPRLTGKPHQKVGKVKLPHVTKIKLMPDGVTNLGEKNAVTLLKLNDGLASEDISMIKKAGECFYNYGGLEAMAYVMESFDSEHDRDRIDHAWHGIGGWVCLVALVTEHKAQKQLKCGLAG